MRGRQRTDERPDARLGMIDVETDRIAPGLRPQTKFWGLAIEHEGYRRFESTEEMRQFLSDRKGRGEPLRLYNWHDFDVSQAIVDGVIPEQLMMRGGRVVRSQIEGIPWVNGYALFPTALSALLKEYGYKKKPLEAGHEPDCDGGTEKKPCTCSGKHQPGCECSACNVILGERNESDCVEGLDSLLKAGRAYQEALGFDPVREDMTTAAKAAMTAAERLAGPLPLWTEHRQAYRGGRTEAFRLYDCGEVDEWDVSSSYPASYVDLPEKDALIFARVRVPIDPMPRPFFRHGPREDGLLFPAGEFDTYFFESTYERYIQPWCPGMVTKVYERLEVDFSWMKMCVPMIERCYELKSKGGALAYPSKIAMNSLYGRMGLKPEATVSRIAPSIPDRPHVTYFKLPESRGYYVFYQVPREIRQGANYLFAAAVTDNARGRLFDGLYRTGEPIYCDTDSVFVPKGTKGLVAGKALGAFEFKKSGPLYVRTVKDYEFAGTTKYKGGSKSTTWTVRRALGGQRVTLVRKNRETRYSKRRVLGDGTTLPLVVRD